jgi:hypothetical protein
MGQIREVRHLERGRRRTGMSDHPTDRQLGEYIDGRAADEDAVDVQAHVEGCPRCRQRIAQAEPAVDLPSLSGFDGRSIELLEEQRPDAPERGQIWRLSWDDDDSLAVVWTVTDDHVLVLPVVERYSADEWCLLLNEQDTTIDSDLAVSVALAATVPWAVLDATVGVVHDTEPLDRLLRGFRSGRATEELLTGEPVLHPTDDRLVALEETVDLYARFADIPWPPAETARVAAPDFDTLLSILGEDQVERVLAISGRDATPTPEEADLIEGATGSRPTGGLLDPEVVTWLSRPKAKPAIRQRATSRHQSEQEAREEVAREAQRGLVAARGTYGRSVDVDLLLERILGDGDS